MAVLRNVSVTLESLSYLSWTMLTASIGSLNSPVLCHEVASKVHSGRDMIPRIQVSLISKLFMNHARAWTDSTVQTRSEYRVSIGST